MTRRPVRWTRKPFDATYKELIDRRADDWLALVRQLLGLPTGLHALPLDADLSTFSLQADKLFHLLKGKRRGILHLELQSTWDDELPLRTAAYNVLARRRFPCDVFSVVVLLAKRANASAITGYYASPYPDGRPCFDFHSGVVRVWERPAEVFLSGPLGTLPLALLTDAAEADLAGTVRRFEERVPTDVPTDPGRAEMLTAGHILMGLRYDKSMIGRVMREVTKMRESSTYQAILEEGAVIGEARGEAKGEVKGRVASLRKMIRQLGPKRLGRLPTKVANALDAVADPDRLERIADSLLDAPPGPICLPRRPRPHHTSKPCCRRW